MGSFRFQCDLCSGPDWDGDDLDTAPICPKCGRSPVRYFTSDTVSCYVHRMPMLESYTTTSAFLLADYTWRGHEDAFPNARLYAVSEDASQAPDQITIAFCAQCEMILQQWLREPR